MNNNFIVAESIASGMTLCLDPLNSVEDLKVTIERGCSLPYMIIFSIENHHESNSTLGYLYLVFFLLILSLKVDLIVLYLD
jgi:hypothetical protein